MFIARHAPRDAQRKRLYDAEKEVAAILRDQLPTIGQVQAFVDSILASRYLQSHFTSSMLIPIAVRGGRGRAAEAMSFLSTISMPQAARSKFIVLHEVAHILTDRYHGRDLTEAHGREFATFELTLVSHFLGADDCRDLLAAFARHGVAHSYREGQLP